MSSFNIPLLTFDNVQVPTAINSARSTINSDRMELVYDLNDEALENFKDINSLMDEAYDDDDDNIVPSEVTAIYDSDDDDDDHDDYKEEKNDNEIKATATTEEDKKQQEPLNKQHPKYRYLKNNCINSLLKFKDEKEFKEIIIGKIRDLKGNFRQTINDNIEEVLNDIRRKIEAATGGSLDLDESESGVRFHYKAIMNMSKMVSM